MDSRDDRRDREKSLNDRLREMAGMSNYDERDRNRDRDRRDQVLRFQPPDEFNRGPARNDFSYQRPEYKEQDDEKKIDLEQNLSREEGVSDGKSKNQSTDNDTQSSENNMDSSQIMDPPIEDNFDGTAGNE